MTIKKPLSEVGKRIDQAKERAGIENDAELARRAKVSTSVISRLKKGERTKQRGETFEKLANALGVSSGWLQTGVGVVKGSAYGSNVEEAIATYVWPKGMDLRTIRKVQAAIHAEADPDDDDDPGPELPIKTIQNRIKDLLEEM